MIIEPEIVSHPKFIHLKSEVGEGAMEMLVRIWGHCQRNKRGEFWPNATSDYVEVVACGHSAKGKVHAALLASGFLVKEDGGIRVHDWSVHNASLAKRWTRAVQTPAQLSTQTPAQLSTQTPAQLSTQAPAQTPAPVRDRTGQDKDRTGQECERAHADGFAEFPTADEVRAWAGMVGVDPEWAVGRAGYLKETNGWLRHGRLVDWRSMFLRWWNEDRADGVGEFEKTGAPENGRRVGPPSFGPGKPVDYSKLIVAMGAAQ